MSKDFLGQGWKFPIEVDSSTGRIKTVSYEDDIREALMIILGTTKGERAMRPDFGSNVNRFVFESMNASNTQLLKKEVLKAIQQWEPRVRDVEVDVNPDPKDKSRLMVEIAYVVRKTNNLFNLVYPFYIAEGTKVE